MRTEAAGALHEVEAGWFGLVLAPVSRHPEYDVAAALQRESSPVVWVTLTGAPRAVVRFWQSRIGPVPEEMVVVDVGGDANDRTVPEAVTARAVHDPKNVTRLGVCMVEELNRMAGDGVRPVVCLTSLSTLLQYVELDHVVHFVEVLNEHIVDAGAVAHVHLDPNAHDADTVETLSPLFDDVVEFADGGPSSTP